MKVSRQEQVSLRASQQIIEVRGRRVILDSDLSAIYGVTTSALNQAVKRNDSRFPNDFRFRLTTEEIADLKSQSVTSSSRHGGRRKLPWAFTEHGAIMAASVLNSPLAVEMSVFVVRAFVRLRDLARTHTEIARHLDHLERRVTAHDASFEQLFSALRQLLEVPAKSPRRIGFGGDTDKK